MIRFTLPIIPTAQARPKVAMRGRFAQAYTLGRPVVVTDSPALLAGGNYSTLGLVAGAATVEESEGQTIMFEPVTGKENLVYRFQGEYAYNVGCLGFKWKKEAGENPADTALAAPANWTKNVSSDKLTAGCRLLSK